MADTAGLTNAAKAAVMNYLRALTASGYNATWTLALFATSAASGTDPGQTPPNGAATVTGEIRGNGTTTAGAPAGGYARQTAAYGTVATTANPSVMSNTGATITFGPASADWASAATPLYVNGWVIHDTSATPNAIWHGAFTTAREVLTNDSVTIAVGALTLSMTND